MIAKAARARPILDRMVESDKFRSSSDREAVDDLVLLHFFLRLTLWALLLRLLVVLQTDEFEFVLVLLNEEFEFARIILKAD